MSTVISMNPRTLISTVFAAIFAMVALIACDRKAGSNIDETRLEVSGIEFLIVRNKIQHYDEYAAKFWCRSEASTSSPRAIDGNDSLEPRGHAGEGWRYFGGYGNDSAALAEDKPASNLQSFGQGTVYFDRALMFTLDGCASRVQFNGREEGVRFETAMFGKGIAYPDYNHHFGPPFLRDFASHDGGGCFVVSSIYLKGSSSQPVFYCTNDKGKNWSLESTRDKVRHLGPQTLSDADRAERVVAKKYREELVQCPMPDGRVFSKQRQECPSAGPVKR